MAISIASGRQDRRNRHGSKRNRCGLILILLLGQLDIAPRQLRAQAIIAPGGRTLFNGATLVRSFVEVNHLSFRTDENSVEVNQLIAPLALVYGVHPKWSVIVAQPYVTAEVTSRRGNEIRKESVNGLGDLQMFAQYDGFYSRNTPGGLTRLSGVFGVQAPTGAQRFSTGAFQYTGGLIFEKGVRLKYFFTGNFEYTFATENDQGVSRGNGARFDAVPAYFLIPRNNAPSSAGWLQKVYHRVLRNGAFWVLEFNGTWQAQGSNQGKNINNSGGTTLSISPGIQYFLLPSLLLEFSAPIPVVKALNGTQPEPQSAFLVGFRYLF